MNDQDRMNILQVEEQLAQLLGAERVTATGDAPRSPYQIAAPVTVFPDREEQVVEVLRWANERGVAVIPKGGGTRDAFGNTPERADVTLSLSRCSGVIQHSVEDLTVSVLPGTPLKELQEALARSGQFLPLESPWEERSTVGGLVAANASGPKRALYGSVRDYLIATRVAYPDGRLIRTGAKVVKNVAGYDMNKLLIGSMGTLGVMTELTFKIRPLAQEAAFLVISVPQAASFAPFQEMLLDSQLEPCMSEYMNAAMAKALGYDSSVPVFVVSFEDVEAAVQYELQQVKSFCAANGLTVLHEGNGREAANALTGRLLHIWPASGTQPDDELIVSAKWLTNITDVPRVHDQATARAGELGLSVQHSGGALTGISRSVIRTGWDQEAAVCDWIGRMQADLQRMEGRSVVEFAPDRLKKWIAVWGEQTPDQKIMKGIKHKIDPNRILNPGRYVGGI